MSSLGLSYWSVQFGAFLLVCPVWGFPVGLSSLGLSYWSVQLRAFLLVSPVWSFWSIQFGAFLLVGPVSCLSMLVSQLWTLAAKLEII